MVARPSPGVWTAVLAEQVNRATLVRKDGPERADVEVAAANRLEPTSGGACKAT